MNDLREWISEVGELTSDGNLTRGVMIIGAAVLTVVLTVWRALRGKTPAPESRVKIDAPASVSIVVTPRGDTHHTVEHTHEYIGQPPERAPESTHRVLYVPTTPEGVPLSGEQLADRRAREEREQRSLSPATRRLAEECGGNGKPACR